MANTVGDFQGWAKNTFGREANPDELNQIGAKVGAPGGPGGAYTDQQYQQGQGYATEMAKGMGWTPPVAPAPAPPPQAAGGPGPIGQASPLTQQLTTQIGQQMSAVPGDMTADPIYKQQVNAFNVASQRNAERSQAQLAESAAQLGQTQSGGMNSMSRGLQEQQGQNETGFASQLAGQRLQQQEQKIQDAMKMALALGDNDLQAQLAQKQAELEQARLEQQGKLGQAGLDLQGKLGQGDLDLRRLLGLGQLDLGHASLNQQGQQHNNTLGFNYAQLQNQMNRDAMLALLGGGGI
jgi:hypothetical protein